MKRLTPKQRAIFLVWAWALCAFSGCVVIYLVLVFDYGLVRVISEPIYTVRAKPAIVLSNGVVWSEGKSTLAFAITAVLWLMLLKITQPQIYEWMGVPPDYSDKK